MSEKIYALVLRLYPSYFREQYGDEALQLLRDRARDEKGFFPTLRLWLDLLADLAMSLPREYRHSRPAQIGPVAEQRGGPTFFVLEDGSQRLRAFGFGGILSVAMLAMIFDVLFQVGGHPTVIAYTHRDPVSSNLRSYPSARTIPQNSISQPNSVAYSSSPPPVPTSPISSQSEKQNPATAAGPTATGAAPMDAAERQRVIDQANADLKRFYFDKDVAQKTAEALLVHAKNGDRLSRQRLPDK
jgi:hypothetical protein